MSKITIKTGSVKFPVTESLYGLFFEDINRSGDGGLYPEMIRNRTFEDSLIPADCTSCDTEDNFFVTEKGWKGDFTHGEGLARWPEANKTPYTPIPAWYHCENAEIALDQEDVLNAKRTASLKINYKKAGWVWNTGYMGVPAVAGRAMNFYMFAKADKPTTLKVAIANTKGEVYCEKAFAIGNNGYVRYDCTFVPSVCDKNAILALIGTEACEVKVGFISLMPAETYNGHGLRADLVQKLADLKPGFMRFPGGCIVEGFNKASLLRFSNMIGPVWERPTNWNLWAYRTTNGLGYHEWLQLCEDLNMKKMWVFNCGLTCQGRHPEYLTGEDFDVLLQEAIDAIEYATAPVGTKWGDMRAAAGHPEPFGMDYVEIGNENWGPEYNSRYEKCYQVLKEKYPDIVYISNTHTERDGLPTEIADEHFYSTPEFFAEHAHRYDSYPRKAEGGPEIFVGEYAVTAGQPGTLRAALGEAMFLFGLERNQDIVTLASYAPLFENVSFYNWYPNLICFDNTASYGIPSWHMLQLLGNNRGKDFVETSVCAEVNYKEITGVFTVFGGRNSFRMKNIKVDGAESKPAAMIGALTEDNGVYTAAPCQMPEGFITRHFLGRGLEDSTRVQLSYDPKVESTLEASIECNGSIILESYVRGGSKEDPFALAGRGFCWELSCGKSKVYEDRFFDRENLGEDKDFVLSEGWHDFKIVTRQDGFDCYVDGELVQEAKLPSYSAVDAVADVTEDEVIVKIVNFTDKQDTIEVALDCDVKSDYCVQLLTGDALDGNSIEEPEKVKAVELCADGAARNFIYNAPAYSLSILRLKK